MALPFDVSLADFSTGLRYGDIPQAVRKTALDCITDCIGVAIAGTGSDAWRRARASLQDETAGQTGPCTVLGQAMQTTPANAAFLNGVAAHAYDFDDTCFAGIVHASAVVLPAALAAAQALPQRCGADLITAFVAGVETAARLGLALKDTLYNKGHWSTGVLGVVGAAAAVARLLGLTRDQTVHALRIALNMPIGLRSILGGSGKPYLCGEAARSGLACARAARAGITCPDGTLAGQYGFITVINDGVFASEEASGARPASTPTAFCMASPGVAFKFHPMCSAGQAAVQASLALRDRHGLRHRDIVSVTCHGTDLVQTSLRYPDPRSLTQAQFSLTFSVACSLVLGRFGIAELEGQARADPDVRRLMARITLAVDDTLVAAADRMRYPEATRVSILTRDSGHIEHTVLAAHGMPDDPADDARLHEKFSACAAPVLGADRARDLLAAILALPGAPSLDPLARLAGGVSAGQRADAANARHTTGPAR